mgnify:CR=1 FL=1
MQICFCVSTHRRVTHQPLTPRWPPAPADGILNPRRYTFCPPGAALLDRPFTVPRANKTSQCGGPIFEACRHADRVPRHVANVEHPQNFWPAPGPRRATRSTMGEPQVGHIGTGGAAGAGAGDCGDGAAGRSPHRRCHTFTRPVLYSQATVHSRLNRSARTGGAEILGVFWRGDGNPRDFGHS